MPIPLRPDFDATSLRFLARESEDANQVRRLLALAAVYDGARRTQAAEIGGVTLQVVRDWVLKFNARGPEGLIDRKAAFRRRCRSAAPERGVRCKPRSASHSGESQLSAKSRPRFEPAAGTFAFPS